MFPVNVTANVDFKMILKLDYSLFIYRIKMFMLIIFYNNLSHVLITHYRIEK